MLPKLYRELFADVVEQASEQMSNNSCNDFDVTVTDENRKELREFCGDIALDEDHLTSLLDQLDEGKIWFQDWMLLDLLQKKLEAGNV